jgi:hypothetical protein
MWDNGRRMILIQLCKSSASKHYEFSITYTKHEVNRPELLHINLHSHNGLRNVLSQTRAGGTHRSLEYHEEVLVVVRIHRLAPVAEVLRAVHATEPLADDPDHAAVTDGGIVQNILKVLCISRQ